MGVYDGGPGAGSLGKGSWGRSSWQGTRGRGLSAHLALLLLQLDLDVRELGSQLLVGSL